jgi:predicted nucleic-acid-binding Zn-ribbon protein
MDPSYESMEVFTIRQKASYISFTPLFLVLVNWLYIITCKKCGYISTNKLPESKAKEMIRAHLGSQENCTRGHVKLVEVRA